jgi:hypothetical protein
MHSAAQALISILGTIDDLPAIEVLSIGVEVEDAKIVLQIEICRIDAIVTICGTNLLHIVIITGTVCHLLDLLGLLPIE